MTSYRKRSHPWDAASDNELRQHWREGLTAGEIAEKMEGRTRNAILGRANRLGLARRGNPVTKRPGRKPGQPTEPKQAPLTEPVNRDPCPRCGVRGEIGCEHRPRHETPAPLAAK